MYCLKCRSPKQPAAGMADYLPMSATSGNLRALCPDCGKFMHRRASLAKVNIVGAVLANVAHVPRQVAKIAKPTGSKSGRLFLLKALVAAFTKEGEMPNVVDKARLAIWPETTFTNEPIPSSIRRCLPWSNSIVRSSSRGARISRIERMISFVL
jgi:hypothetical protein